MSPCIFSRGRCGRPEAKKSLPYARRSRMSRWTLPKGGVRIDSDNRHCFLTPRIGVSRRGGGFDIIFEAAQPVKPDPYLVWDEARVDRRPAAPGIEAG